MKPLSNHILIFDKDCPLCSAYTHLFVRYGFLTEEGRQSYQDMDFINTNIDTELARNKIALFNTETKEAVYGIDAMTKVLGNKIPLISYSMRFKPLYWLMTQIYSLISYNRKIIIPVSCKNLTSCNPTQSWFWRSLFILICFIPVQLILPAFLYSISGNVDFMTALPAGLFFGQIIFQTLMCKLINEKNIYDYTGHVSLITMSGGILLALLIPFLRVFESSAADHRLPALICFGLISVWMLFEHQRRMKILGMGSWLTFSWMIWLMLLYSLVFLN